jgi:hypothetical protein
MLKWLYQKNKQKFWDFMVADFYADIPDNIREPAIDFLSNARPTLERFWSIQAYNIQRRSISDAKNAQIYQGFLLCIRTLLSVVSKGKTGAREEMAIEGEKKKDPLKSVEEFIKLGKTLNKK